MVCAPPPRTACTMYHSGVWSSGGHRPAAERWPSERRAVPRTEQDTLAEWSKALASGASPQGRGFEPHRCHFHARSLLRANSLQSTPVPYRAMLCGVMSCLGVSCAAVPCHTVPWRTVPCVHVCVGASGAPVCLPGGFSFDTGWPVRPNLRTPCGTRTRNLRIRSPTPCPLGQGGNACVRT